VTSSVSTSVPQVHHAVSRVWSPGAAAGKSTLSRTGETVKCTCSYVDCDYTVTILHIISLWFRHYAPIAGILSRIVPYSYRPQCSISVFEPVYVTDRFTHRRTGVLTNSFGMFSQRYRHFLCKRYCKQVLWLDSYPSPALMLTCG